MDYVDQILETETHTVTFHPPESPPPFQLFRETSENRDNDELKLFLQRLSFALLELPQDI